MRPRQWLRLWRRLHAALQGLGKGILRCSWQLRAKRLAGWVDTGQNTHVFMRCVTDWGFPGMHQATGASDLSTLMCHAGEPTVDNFRSCQWGFQGVILEGQLWVSSASGNDCI